MSYSPITLVIPEQKPVPYVVEQYPLGQRENRDNIVARFKGPYVVVDGESSIEEIAIEYSDERMHYRPRGGIYHVTVSLYGRMEGFPESLTDIDGFCGLEQVGMSGRIELSNNFISDDYGYRRLSSNVQQWLAAFLRAVSEYPVPSGRTELTNQLLREVDKHIPLLEQGKHPAQPMFTEDGDFFEWPND